MQKDFSVKYKSVIIGAVAVLLLVLVFMGITIKPKLSLWEVPASEEEKQKAYEYVPDPDSALIHFTEGINIWYVNEALRFSFRLPDGFTAPDGKLAGSDTRIVELSNGKGNDLLVLALKIKGGSQQGLTEEAIRKNSPEERLTNFASATLPDGTSGFLFETDSEKWGGQGIAFWAAKGEYLYTLTTAKKDRELLELVMKTWRFGSPVPPPAL